jgi:hypothetical protein
MAGRVADGERVDELAVAVAEIHEDVWFQLAPARPRRLIDRLQADTDFAGMAVDGSFAAPKLETDHPGRRVLLYELSESAVVTRCPRAAVIRGGLGHYSSFCSNLRKATTRVGRHVGRSGRRPGQHWRAAPDGRVRRSLYSRATDQEVTVELPIRKGEIMSLRSAARNLYAAVDALGAGEATKYVLLDSKNDMRAVLLTPESYSDLLDAAKKEAA